MRGGRQRSEPSTNGILYPVPPCLNHTFKVMATKEVGETHVDLHASILATWMATIIPRLCSMCVRSAGNKAHIYSMLSTLLFAHKI